MRGKGPTRRRGPREASRTAVTPAPPPLRGLGHFRNRDVAGAHRCRNKVEHLAASAGEVFRRVRGQICGDAIRCDDRR